MVTTTRLSRYVRCRQSCAEHIERSAEYVVLLYDGKLRWQGSVEAFRCSDNPYVVQFRTASLTDPCSPRSCNQLMRRSVREATIGFSLLAALVGGLGLWFGSQELSSARRPTRFVCASKMLLAWPSKRRYLSRCACWISSFGYP